MLVLNKRSDDLESSRIVNKALLCKMFRCRPSELDDEDSHELQQLMIVYNFIGKENPFIMM